MPAFPNDLRGGLAARIFPAGLFAIVAGIGLYFDHAGPFEDPATTVATKETAMNQPRTTGPATEAGHAPHGPRSEVTWEGGSGRQPYGNQGHEEAAEPGASEVAEGNRGERSGRNAAQLDEARRKP